jgi:hypothetical protein
MAGSLYVGGFLLSVIITLCVATLTLGSRPRQKSLKGAGQEECENEDSHSQVSSPFGSWSPGSWSPGGLPNLQRAISEVKTPCIEELFISLESY